MRIFSFRKMAEEQDNGASAGGAPDVTPAADAAPDNWGELSEASVETEFDAPAAPPESVQVEQTPAPAEVPAVSPVAAEPPVQPQAPQPAVQQPEPAQPAEAPVDMKALRAQYETELTAYYAMDAQTAERLQTEPELVLPQLAARVHLEVLDAVLAQLPHRVNAMIQQRQTAQTRETEAEDSFFGAFPDLREHKDAVLRVGQMYRAANPKATKDEAVKAIGEFVRQSLGLTAPVPTAPPAIQQQKPFTPAVGGGNGAPAQASEWDFITQDD